MRYAFLHPTFSVLGGVEMLLAATTRELVRRGHEVTLFTSDTASASVLSEPATGVNVVDLDIGPLYYDRLSFRDWKRIGERIAPELLGHDVVTVHGLPSPLWWAAALESEPTLLDLPSVWFCHGLAGWLYDDVAGARLRRAKTDREDGGGPLDLLGKAVRLSRQRGPRWTLGKLGRVARVGLGDVRPAFAEAEKAIVPRFTSVLANSAFTAERAERVFGVHPIVCHPGLSDAALSRDTTHPGRDLLTVARLEPSKNVITLLEATTELRRRGEVPFRRHVVVGDGPELVRLRRYAEDSGISDLVDFTGAMRPEDVDEYYERCGLFALPALDEGFGLVYLEAAVRARPALAPDHGGPAEIVVDGETGWLVDPMDPVALADAITEAFSDPDRLARRGAAARQRVSESFTFSGFVDCFERSCKDAVRKVGAGGAGQAGEA